MKTQSAAHDRFEAGRLASIGMTGQFVDQIVDALPDPLFFLRRTGEIVHANRAGCALAGSTLSRVVGRSVDEVLLMRPFDNTVIAEALARNVTLCGTATVQDGRKVLLSARPVAVGDSQIVVLAVTRASSLVAPGQENAAVGNGDGDERRRPETDDDSPGAIVAQSRMLAAVREKAERYAGADSPVLLLGETGTGKSLFAKLIHQTSHRCRHPFKTINCGAIPPARMDAELFGCAADVPPGTERQTLGAVELAHHGTLVLDEVAELPPALQVKLLHFLETGDVWPIGASKPRRADVRIIATTSQDLGGMIARRIFREDLFYRLGVLVIQMPPLREHPEDIPPLIEMTLDRLAARLEVRKRMTPEALEVMKRRRFPGNVRELRSTVERLVLTLPGDVIDAGDVDTDDVEPRLPPVAQLLGSERIDLRQLLRDMEAGILRAALRKCGTQARAARYLGVGQATVARKSKQYGLTS